MSTQPLQAPLRYTSGQAFLDTPDKAIALMGMSGVGKSTLSNLLRRHGEWYHYAVDYRIGARYLNEEITDFLRARVARDPLIAQMLRDDTIRVEPKMGLEKLAPLTLWLGGPGARELGGTSFEEYLQRQQKHRLAEVKATRDTVEFNRKGHEIFGYQNFVCDTSGSLCEVVNPDDPNDELGTLLSKETLPVYIRSSLAHEDLLRERFEKDPKPIYFREEYLAHLWANFRDIHGEQSERLDPMEWMRFSFEGLVKRRREIYEAIAKRWGVTLRADDVEPVRRPQELVDLIANAIDQRVGDQRVGSPDQVGAPV